MSMEPAFAMLVGLIMLHQCPDRWACSAFGFVVAAGIGAAGASAFASAREVGWTTTLAEPHTPVADLGSTRPRRLRLRGRYFRRGVEPDRGRSGTLRPARSYWPDLRTIDRVLIELHRAGAVALQAVEHNDPTPQAASPRWRCGVSTRSPPGRRRAARRRRIRRRPSRLAVLRWWLWWSLWTGSDPLFGDG